MYLQGMKQVYPRVEKVSASSFSSRGLFFSSIWTVRSRKRKVLSRKRKLGLDLFLSGIYLFPALQNIYSIRSRSFSGFPDKSTFDLKPYDKTPDFFQPDSFLAMLQNRQIFIQPYEKTLDFFSQTAFQPYDKVPDFFQPDSF